MSEHLTADDLKAYARGEASVAAMLAWDDHLAGCAECRTTLHGDGSLANWSEELAQDEDEQHLSYEQIVARATNRVADAERFEVEQHLAMCSACRAEVADLAQFRKGLTAAPPQRASRRRPWISAAIGMAAALVVGVGLWFTASSRLVLPASWTAEDRELVADTLRNGTLPFAPPPADALSRAGTLLGPSRADAFAPLSPVGVVVESNRPQFRWQELAGAASYRVEIYDAEFHPVAQSPSLSVAAWTPEQPLDRGRLYRWQVSATRDGATITVPAPPAPDAQFRVLDAATEARVEGARKGDPAGHLLAAVLLARSGMRDEALRELEAMPAETRRRPEIERLIKQAGNR